MEMEMDFLSALPDCLLLRILCSLGLKEAAKTAALSKQWRFLWTNLPFDMWCDSYEMEERRSFVDSVDAALTLCSCRAPAFNTFDVSFYYDNCFAPSVDLWLHLTARSKVKHLHLYLEPTDYSNPHRYTLPQIVYSNSSLTKLNLENCIFPSPETTVEWRRLKRLFLVAVDLPIGEIVSNCPLLKKLSLSSCTGFNRIEIGGRRFRRMYLSYGGDEPLLEISAPYMTELELIMPFTKSGRTVRLENAQSLEILKIDFRAIIWDSISVETLRAAMLMFLHLDHVKELHLSSACTKVISIMSRNGWRIAKPRLKSLGMMAKSDHVHNICGIVAMLESSPNLESLIITSNGSEKEDQESISWGPITRDDLHCDLLHLKTVTFEVSCAGEPTLTLAKILLKRAPFLEKIVIINKKPWLLSTEDHDDLIRTVLNYPKSSRNVSVGKR